MTLNVLQARGAPEYDCRRRPRRKRKFAWEGMFLLGGDGQGASFHKLALERNGVIGAISRAERDGSMPDVPAYIARTPYSEKPTERSPMPANPVVWNLDERGV